MAMPAIVLAGERAGGSPLARAHGVATSALLDVAGQASLARVIDTLRASTAISGGMIVGPAGDLHRQHTTLKTLFAAGDYRWLAPANGPSASALGALDQLDRFPVLITAADHALLTPEIVDEFCQHAGATDADFVAGVVPYNIVRASYPDSQRTRTRFADGAVCGANLFMVRRHQGEAVLEFWRELEKDRKRPWRMAARLGLVPLLRYLLRRMDRAEAAQVLSEQSGARVEFVVLNHARAAIDVDSQSDLELATAILTRVS